MEKEFCEYLKQRHFSRFMKAWKRQFEKLGHVGGTIKIPLDNDNQEDIEMLMQKNYHRQTHATIAYSSLVKVLDKTKYNEVDFNEVLHLYFNDIILSNKDKKTIQYESELKFMNTMIDKYQESLSSKWLQSCVDENNPVFIRLRQEFHKSSQYIETLLNDVMNAINQLPLKNHQHCSIVMFANEMTRDPHGFDKGTFSYYLLIQGIRYLRNDNYQEERIILHDVGLYEDTINNYCMICHIDAYDIHHEIHQGWHGFYLNYEMWNPNMHNMVHISDIELHSLTKVFIVENPSIFSVLCDYAKENHFSQYGFICTNGQLHTSAYVLLDLLSEYSIPLYYSGDFDPEGLMIADRLMKRYSNLKLWHYDIEDYLCSLSDKYANQKRLAINRKLENPMLIEIGQYLSHSAIGYQENLLNKYLEDLKSDIK